MGADARFLTLVSVTVVLSDYLTRYPNYFDTSCDFVFGRDLAASTVTRIRQVQGV